MLDFVFGVLEALVEEEVFLAIVFFLVVFFSAIVRSSNDVWLEIQKLPRTEKSKIERQEVT